MVKETPLRGWEVRLYRIRSAGADSDTARSHLVRDFSTWVIRVPCNVVKGIRSFKREDVAAYGKRCVCVGWVLAEACGRGFKGPLTVNKMVVSSGRGKNWFIQKVLGGGSSAPELSKVVSPLTEGKEDAGVWIG